MHINCVRTLIMYSMWGQLHQTPRLVAFRIILPQLFPAGIWPRTLPLLIGIILLPRDVSSLNFLQEKINGPLNWYSVAQLICLGVWQNWLTKRAHENIIWFKGSLRTAGWEFREKQIEIPLLGKLALSALQDSYRLEANNQSCCQFDFCELRKSTISKITLHTLFPSQMCMAQKKLSYCCLLLRRPYLFHIPIQAMSSKRIRN